MLIANGENVVVQELMRHANSRCTLDVYTQARIPAKREAQQRVVQMILPEERLGGIKLLRHGPDERLDTQTETKSNNLSLPNGSFWIKGK